MILDAGRANAVKPGQAVIDARGMIGRIYLAGNHTSWVILLTDLNSRVPVTIEPGHAAALLAGDNQKAPMLETLAQGAQIKPGDQVVSSGDGGILPPGLPIGTVIAEGAGFRVALLSDPATSQEVNVVDFRNPMETPPNPTAKDLPVTAAGLPPAAPPPPPVAAAPTSVPAMPAAGNTTAPQKTPPAALKPAAAPKPKTGEETAPASDDPADNQ
jgi:rod shape-determining protein MreC